MCWAALQRKELQSLNGDGDNGGIGDVEEVVVGVGVEGSVVEKIDGEGMTMVIVQLSPLPDFVGVVVVGGDDDVGAPHVLLGWKR